jgi:hypothetical protein
MAITTVVLAIEVKIKVKRFCFIFLQRSIGTKKTGMGLGMKYLRAKEVYVPVTSSQQIIS